MKKLLLATFIFQLLTLICFAQQNKIDSLLILLIKDKPDTTKVNRLITLCNEYRKNGDYESALKYGNDALQLSSFIAKVEGTNISSNGNQKPSDMPGNMAYLAAQKGRASSYNNIGNIFYNKGNYPQALKNYFASLQINEELKNKKDIAGSYLNIGIIYYYQNNYPEALKNYVTALNLRQEIGDKQGVANAYGDIGLVYDNPGNYPEALKNFFAALNIYENIGDKKGIAASYNDIGRIYNNQYNYQEALKMYFASLKINEDIGDKYGIAFSYNNIGNIYWNQVNYPEDDPIRNPSHELNSIASAKLLNSAFEHYFAALKLREDTGDKKGIIESFINLGNVQLGLKKLKEAQNYLNKALLLSKEIDSKEWIKESYLRLLELDSTQGNWKTAYQHHKLFILYRDSIETEETIKKSLQSAMNYDYEKKEAATKVEQDKKDAVSEAETKKQKNIIGLVIITLLLSLVFAIYFFRSRPEKKRNISGKEQTRKK